MTTLIHADIFFFVTTIVVFFVGIAATVALVYLVFILKDIKELSKNIQEEGNEIVRDVHEFREKVKEQGTRWSNMASVFGIIRNAAEAVTRKKRAHRAKKATETNEETN